MSEDVSTEAKFRALRAAVAYRPVAMALIVLLSIGTTLLEGIGLGFLIPVIEYARSGATDSGGSALLEPFVRAYGLLGVPFTLEFVILGVALVMTVRIVVGYLVSWLSLRIQTNYVRDLQTEAFDRLLGARLGYLDRRGSDELLNELVTRVYYAETVFGGVIGLVQQGLLVVMYFAVAAYLAPVLTVVSTAVFAALALAVRALSEPAERLGERVTTAHERVQSLAQAGVKGIRDVQLFGMDAELSGRFRSSVERYATSTIALGRNQEAMESGYHLVAMYLVFALLYVALARAGLSLGELGVLLFAVYRLVPQINGLNGQLYHLEGSLPHVVRTYRFLDDLERNRQPDGALEPVPDAVDRVAFADVSFAYDAESVVRDLSFSAERDEFVAFVGASGAGKSTVAALLARLYEPDEGRIVADGTPIDHFDVDEWRSRVAVVPQDPYVFDETLRYNVTVGVRDATDRAVERACEAAQVTEFLDDLTDGYDTELGDDGVRLSGGQRQRVAIARALVRDADVLVLDEATSDLDGSLEERVHAGIDSLERDYTVVLITHRLDAVANADRIYAIENGRITEAGRHQELLERDGKYSDLYTAQSRSQ